MADQILAFAAEYDRKSGGSPRTTRPVILNTGSPRYEQGERGGAQPRPTHRGIRKRPPTPARRAGPPRFSACFSRETAPPSLRPLPPILGDGPAPKGSLK